MRTTNLKNNSEKNRSQEFKHEISGCVQRFAAYKPDVHWNEIAILRPAHGLLNINKTHSGSSCAPHNRAKNSAL